MVAFLSWLLLVAVSRTLVAEPSSLCPASKSFESPTYFHHGYPLDMLLPSTIEGAANVKSHNCSYRHANKTPEKVIQCAVT